MQNNVIITGASGWIGKEVIYYHYKKNKSFEGIYPISQSCEYIEFDFGKVKCYKIEELQNIKNAHLYHLAFITNDKVSQLSMQEYEMQNIKLREKIISLINNNDIKVMFYASSGAVYERGTQDLIKNIETQPYGYCKMKDEIFFQDFCSKKNIKLLICRIFSIIGKFINKTESYAISNMINQAKNNGEIEIKSQNLTYRNYINIQDLINIIYHFLSDKNSEIFYLFDSFGKTFEMEELAKIILEKHNLSHNNIIRNLDTTLKPDNYYGNKKMQDILTKRYKIITEVIF